MYFRLGGLHLIIADVQVYAIDVHVAQMFIGLTALEIVDLAALHVLERWIGEESVFLSAGGFDHSILEQAMN